MKNVEKDLKDMENKHNIEKTKLEEDSKLAIIREQEAKEKDIKKWR